MARRIPADRFQQLVDCATQVFIERGYAHTQMADVAEAMGVAKGTLYLYVESKEALFDLVLRSADAAHSLTIPSDLPVRTPRAGETLQHVRDRLANQSPLGLLLAAIGRKRVTDPRAELSAILREMYQTLSTNRRAIKLMDRSAQFHPELAAVWFSGARGAIMDALATYLASRIRLKHFCPVPDVQVAARLVLETIVTWAVHRHWDASPQAIDDQVAEDTVVQFLVGGLTKEVRVMRSSTLSDRDARRYDIDWLRVFATYLLLLFHVGMVFNPAPFYHVRNGDVSFFFLVLCGFIGLWHMPLFFLLAGWSAFASLSMRGTGGFLKERFFRLFVPLVTGCVLLMPSIKYLELSSGLDANYTGLYVAPALQESFRQVIPTGLPVAPPFHEGFLEFLPTFFTDLSRFTWAHLWFVVYLLTFTLLYLPLFGRIMRSREWFRDGMSPLWVYAPILPLAAIQVAMRERWPGLQNLIDDWANFSYYSLFLIAGFLLARFPSLEKAAQRERTRALAIGLLATLVLLLGVLGVFSSPAILLAHTAVAGWCFVIAFLGWARRALSFTTPTLGYLTESAFPVYVLHQAAIVVPGYFLLQLPLGLWTKFVLLFVVSSVLTVAVYHYFVRPFAVPRFLFGMKARAGALRPRLAPGLSAAGVALVAMVAVGGSTSSEASPQAAASPIGRWYAEGGAAQVDVSDCGGGLCGEVTWLRSPFDEDGCELRDRYNPDPALRERPVVGVRILSGLERIEEHVWSGGTVYDPASGNTYHCSLSLEGENRLQLRGYIGVPLFGRTTTWIRVGSESQMCRR